jgi:hypothetical protein
LESSITPNSQQQISKRVVHPVHRVEDVNDDVGNDERSPTQNSDEFLVVAFQNDVGIVSAKL